MFYVPVFNEHSIQSRIAKLLLEELREENDFDKIDIRPEDSPLVYGGRTFKLYTSLSKRTSSQN